MSDISAKTGNFVMNCQEMHTASSNIFSRIVLISAISCGLVLSSCSTHKNTVTPSKPTPSIQTPSPSSQLPEVRGLAPETQALISEARDWLGTRYQYGGNTKKGVDCSGFILQVFLNALGIKLPRSSADQGAYCDKISKNDLVVGDLIFFITSGGKRISHVGMYVGEGKMIHASTSNGVIISSLSEDYYVRHFHSYGRVGQYYALIDTKGKKKNNKNKKETMESSPQIIEISVETPARASLEAVRKAAAGKTASTPEEIDALIKKSFEAENRRAELDRVIEEKTDSIISKYFD